MFSIQLETYAKKRWEERSKVYEPILPSLMKQLNQCTKDEQVLLEFLYGTMPVRDAGEYEFEVFLSYVKHAIYLRERMEWTKVLPEDYFIHYVFYPRINSENITVCRPFFYERLVNRIKDLSQREAVLEINYWCAENATYEASDGRTSSPLTVYYSGKGRCGEESTFAVTAFRSVGIAARQVYTPRWAHCDDNHAWVEVFVDGEWCFLGACEPEEVLNKGWFLNASSRALLVHSRTFSDFRGDSKEEHIGKEDLLSYYNSTATYAKTRTFTVVVKDRNQQLVPGAKISLQILNYAEFASVTELTTDALGKASMTMGLGDVLIRATKDGYFGEVIGHGSQQEEVTICLEHSLLAKDWVADTWEMWEIEAPKDCNRYHFHLTKDQQATNRRRLKEAKELRENRIDSYYKKELAEQIPEAKEILLLAKGNFIELYQFLNKENQAERLALCKTLSVKDYKDVSAYVLEEHLHGKKGSYDEEFAMKYLLCPRIYLEELTAFRSYITTYFGEDMKSSFIENPNRIWKYIKENITYLKEFDYQTITATPIGCLKMQQGNELSQKIVFVAICRTLGIPARIHKVTMDPEYFNGVEFCVPVGDENDQETKKDQEANKGQETNKEQAINKEVPSIGKGTLILQVENPEQWTYGQNFTIGKLQGDQYLTLDYEGLKLSSKEKQFTLEEGIYRVIVTTRMPNGNQHVATRTFMLSTNQEKSLKMTLRENQLEDLLVENEIADFEIFDGKKEYLLSSIMKNHHGILAFLEEGKEPTEHVLNEMLEEQAQLRELEGTILFVVKDRDALTNDTFKKVLENIPNIQVYYDAELEHAEPVARRMYVDPDKLPLLVALRNGRTGVYSCAGYNVGSVALILKILGKIGMKDNEIKVSCE